MTFPAQSKTTVHNLALTAHKHADILDDGPGGVSFGPLFCRLGTAARLKYGLTAESTLQTANLTRAWANTPD